MCLVPYGRQLGGGFIVIKEGESPFKIRVLLGFVKETHVHGNAQPVLGRPLLGRGGHGRYAVFHNFAFVEQVAIGAYQVQAGLVEDQVLQRERKIPVEPWLKCRTGALGGVILEIVHLEGGGRPHVAPGKIIGATTPKGQGGNAT